jgi:hypothetical protein
MTDQTPKPVPGFATVAAPSNTPRTPEKKPAEGTQFACPSDDHGRDVHGLMYDAPGG